MDDRPHLPPVFPEQPGDDMASIVVIRIRQRLADLGLEPTGSEVKQRLQKAGAGWNAINNILTARSKRPSAVMLGIVAVALECDVPYLLGHQDQPRLQKNPVENTIRIPIIGTVETGAFRRMAAGPVDERLTPAVHAPASKNYPTNKHFAMRVANNDMAGARPPILAGMTVLCVDIADAGIEVEGGKIYVVRRTLDAGQTFEWTCRRAHVFQDRIELRPEPADPSLETIVIRSAADDGQQVEVIGLVYGAFASFE